MKVSELEGDLLNEWVAKADGYEGSCDAWKKTNFGSAGGPAFVKYDCKHKKCYPKDTIGSIHGKMGGCPEFSTNWSWGGPIIERELIEISYDRSTILPEKWWAVKWEEQPWTDQNYLIGGVTPLIAAMRAFVASSFGEEVE